MHLFFRCAILSATVLATDYSKACFAQVPQEELKAFLQLFDNDKLSSINQGQEIRARQVDRNVIPLMDFGYGLLLVKYARWTDAVAVLEKFVQERPQVFRAHLLLVRCFIELQKFEEALVAAERILVNLPTVNEELDEVSRSLGIYSGYLEFARTDAVPVERQKRFAEECRNKLPEAQRPKFDEGVAFVKSQVEKLTDEIEKMSGKVEEETEAKIAENLETAEKLRSEVSRKEEQLAARAKEKEEQLAAMRNDLDQLELATGTHLARAEALNDHLIRLAILQQSLVREVETTDPDGNKVRSTEITNPFEYNRLGRVITAGALEQRELEGQARVLMNSYQQLRARAAGMMNEKELDQFFTKSKMNDLSKSADSKQKKAERESERKSRRATAAGKGLALRIKSFSTYQSVDIAANVAYLKAISQKAFGVL